MMTGTTSAQCLRVMLLPFGLVALLLAAGCATNTSQQANANMVAANTPRLPASSTSQKSFYSKLVLAGRFDCKTNNVEVTEGVLERGRFENLDTLSAVMADKGYGRAALAELKDLKVCLLDEDDFKRLADQPHGEVATAESLPSLLLKLQLKAPYVLFSLTETNFEGYATLASYLEAKEEQKACERVNDRCVICPDNQIYCVKPKK
jgi:hypothetical protein